MRRRHLLGLPLLGAASLAPAQPAGLAWPTLQLVDGRTLSAESWQGRSAVVVFWATYCPYCQRHNAHVDKLHRAAAGLPGRVLGVALDRDAGLVRRHLATAGHSFPVALDDGVLRQRLAPRRVIPMTCLVDPRGRLVQAIPGEMAEDDVLGLLRHLRQAAG